jgi:hypothetical protein
VEGARDSTHPFRRRRSDESPAPSTTVRSLRELQWSPSPAIAGADANKFSRKNRQPEFRSALSRLRKKKCKEAERRQTQGLLTVPRERMSPLARASGPARAEAQRAHLSAFHRGTCGSDRTPPLNSSYALPGTELGRSGRYPLPAVPKCSGLPRSTGRSAGRAYPPEPPGSAADEAAPAGTAFAPANRNHRLASLLSELFALY